MYCFVFFLNLQLYYSNSDCHHLRGQSFTWRIPAPRFVGLRVAFPFQRRGFFFRTILLMRHSWWREIVCRSLVLTWWCRSVAFIEAYTGHMKITNNKKKKKEEELKNRLWVEDRKLESHLSQSFSAFRRWCGRKLKETPFCRTGAKGCFFFFFLK